MPSLFSKGGKQEQPQQISVQNSFRKVVSKAESANHSMRSSVAERRQIDVKAKTSHTFNSKSLKVSLDLTATPELLTQAGKAAKSIKLRNSALRKSQPGVSDELRNSLHSYLLNLKELKSVLSRQANAL
jgi:hypothetical protein